MDLITATECGVYLVVKEGVEFLRRLLVVPGQQADQTLYRTPGIQAVSC